MDKVLAFGIQTVSRLRKKALNGILMLRLRPTTPSFTFVVKDYMHAMLHATKLACGQIETSSQTFMQLQKECNWKFLLSSFLS